MIKDLNTKKSLFSPEMGISEKSHFNQEMENLKSPISLKMIITEKSLLKKETITRNFK